MSVGSNIKENWLFDFYNQDSYLNFDGVNDYIDLGGTTSTSPISVSSNGSIAFWINFPVLGTQEDIFYNNSQDSNYSGILIAKGSDNKIAITWGDAAGAGESNRETMTSGTALEANKWYFVVIGTNFESSIVDRNSNCKIWINGDASGNVTNSGTSDDNAPSYSPNGVAYIGREVVGTDAYGRFKLKNLAVYNVFLNQANVNSLYNSGNYINFTEVRLDDLVAYYKFNNNKRATDFINNQSGKIYGASYENSELHLSFQDTVYNSNYYHGVVTNQPSIRESIDLSTSKSSRSNINIDIPDFKYKNKLISEELFGTNVYLNYSVKVYSQINDGTPTLIGCFRTSDISTSGNSISISLKSFNPWDNISSPQVKHPLHNIYEPVVYGDFTGGADTNSSNQAYGVMGTVFPVPVLQISSNFIWTLMPRAYVASDNSFIHNHVDGFNAQFTPLRLHSQIFTDTSNRVDSGTSTTLDDSGLNILSSRIRAKDNSGDWKNSAFAGYITTEVTDPEYGGSVTYFDNQENMFKWKPNNVLDDTVFASKSFDVSTLDTYYLMVQTPKKRFTLEYVYYYLARISVEATDGSLGTEQQINWDAFSNQFDSSNDDLIDYNSFGNYARFYDTVIRGGTGSNSTYSGGIALGLTAGNKIDNRQGAMCPDNLLLKLQTPSGTGLSGYNQEDFKCKIHSLQLYHVVELPAFSNDDDVQDDHEQLARTEYFYSGGNGLQHNIVGLAGNNITEIHEAHLDLMNRFAGFDVDSDPTNTNQIIGYGSDAANDGLLDDTKDWKIRYWQLEPTSLAHTLEKLQYEGGFIFRFRRGDQNQPEYIFIKDSYTSTDLTLSQYDLKNININPDSFNSIVTKMDINYQKHPNPSNTKYLFLQNCSNPSSKAEYVINAKENKKDIKLDAYVYPEIPSSPSNNPNDDFYSYYNNINGVVRLNISSELINPKYFDINVGNTVQFTDMYPVKMFDKSFTNMVFMITSISRTVGSIKFKAREIGVIS